MDFWTDTVFDLLLTEIFDLTDFGGLDELNCFCLEGRPWHYLTIAKWTIN